MKQETNKKYPFAVYATAFHVGHFVAAMQQWRAKWNIRIDAYRISTKTH